MKTSSADLMSSRRSGIAAVAACLLLGLLPSLSGLFVRPGSWCHRLRKAWLQPPPGVFGPVWTLLYLSLGLSHYLFLTADKAGNRTAGNLTYGLQLASNAAWHRSFSGSKHHVSRWLISAWSWCNSEIREQAGRAF